jgi:hypothetical protein
MAKEGLRADTCGWSSGTKSDRKAAQFFFVAQGMSCLEYD